RIAHSTMSLTNLILGFVRRYWLRYLASAMILTVVALLIAWIPRQVGHVIDQIVAGRVARDDLLVELAKLVGAGVAIYFLRVAWRLQLYAASFELGLELRCQLYQKLSLQGPGFYQRQRTGDLMALSTNDVDAIE